MNRGVTILEVLILLGCVALLGGLAVAAADDARERDNRIRCASNLRLIGQAMRQYAIDDVRGGVYPRTRYDPRAADRGPVYGTPYDARDLAPREGVNPFHTRDFLAEEGLPADLIDFIPDANDLTAPLWHLLRQGYLGEPGVPAVFVCPGSEQTPFEFKEGVDATHYTNFPGRDAIRDHLSYSFQNMYGASASVGRGFKWTDSLRADFAIGADRNPGTPEALTLSPDADADTVRRANSTHHRGDGQNVLFADGSVRFVLTPLSGVRGDNIYAPSTGPDGDAPDAFRLPPFGAGDSLLLPTHAELTGE